MKGAPTSGLLALMLLGCAPASRTAVAPPAAKVTEATRDRSTSGSQPLTVCVVQDGMLVDLVVTYEGRDTLVDGRPFRDAHPVTPPMYAAGADWFVRMDPIVFNGRRYPAYGNARVLPRSLLTRVGYHSGTPLFAERDTGNNGVVAVLYVPIRPGCVFQAYMPVER
jgi:hypothetical protein